MSLLDGLKSASDLALKYKQMDLYEQIVSLREEALALREDNLQLRGELARLRMAEATSQDLVRRGNCYYKTSDTGDEHPYCLTCWDHDRKLISMTLVRGVYEDIRVRCGICESRGQ